MAKEPQRAVRFILGLSLDYRQYKKYFVDNLKEWPVSLELAFADAYKFEPERSNNQVARSQIFVTDSRDKGRGRGRGRGRTTATATATATAATTAPAASESSYGSRKGSWNRCKELGHHAWECRSRGGHATGAPTVHAAGHEDKAQPKK